MITYRCDKCKREMQKSQAIVLKAWDKNKQATNKGNRSIRSIDLCSECYTEMFGDRIGG